MYISLRNQSPLSMSMNEHFRHVDNLSSDFKLCQKPKPSQVGTELYTVHVWLVESKRKKMDEKKKTRILRSCTVWLVWGQRPSASGRPAAVVRLLQTKTGHVAGTGAGVQLLQTGSV